MCGTSKTLKVLFWPATTARTVLPTLVLSTSKAATNRYRGCGSRPVDMHQPGPVAVLGVLVVVATLDQARGTVADPDDRHPISFRGAMSVLGALPLVLATITDSPLCVADNDRRSILSSRVDTCQMRWMVVPPRGRRHADCDDEADLMRARPGAMPPRPAPAARCGGEPTRPRCRSPQPWRVCTDHE